ncbi:hypothetical protein [Rickettsia tamurae]|nr:hypothetical protein [Rickettsia tamurae]
MLHKSVSFPRGIVARTSKIHCVIPWLGHGMTMRNRSTQAMPHGNDIE